MVHYAWCLQVFDVVEMNCFVLSHDVVLSLNLCWNNNKKKKAVLLVLVV